MAQDFTYPSVSELRYKDLRFLITDSPDDENVPSFIEVRIKYNYNILSVMFFFCIGLFKTRCYSISSSFRKNLRYKTYRSSWNKSLCT
jgi:hypothetical protein